MDSKTHDYAYLFEDPEMVRQLLETCVDEGWVSELVIEGLEPMRRTSPGMLTTSSRSTRFRGSGWRR